VYFLEDFCRRNNFKPKTIEDGVFEAFERMAILTPAARITPEMVPLEIRLPRQPALSSLQEVRANAERDRIRQALESCDWNVSRAARLLNIGRTTLHKRLQALHLSGGRT
jgi:transcriptional regulator of acetoin/glycerol metabolism